jgi:hypothetical protein
MRTLEIINMEKHQPGYLTRKNTWAKIHFSMWCDHGFSTLCEIDKWRFINFILIQIKTKNPVVLDLKYLTNIWGMDFKERRLESTIRQLTKAELVTISEGTDRDQRGISEGSDKEQEKSAVVNKGLTTAPFIKNRIEKSRVYKKKHIAKMVPPTLKELSRYIHEKRYQVNAQEFFDKYENENPPWSNNKGKPMTSWKSTLVTWNGNAQNKSQQATNDNRDKNGVVY